MTKPNFKAFADDMLEISWQGHNADGGEIQELAQKHGLIKLVKMTEPCCEYCICAEAGGFPIECYRKTY